jgi:mono/diheme cytochrome c family protein
MLAVGTVIGCKLDKKSAKRSENPQGTQTPDLVEASADDPTPAKFGQPVDRQSNAFCSEPTQSVSESTLSPSYQEYCSGCHGMNGRGRGGFPDLSKVKDQDNFLSTVRNGKGLMPGFSEALIDEVSIRKDFEKITSGLLPTNDAKSTDIVTTQRATSITASQYNDAMKRGLVAWRLPGERGACAACHGPDGIDLAVIGYPASAILRRAHGQGLNPKLAMDIVQMIAAQRNYYRISSPCEPATFRPLQPGFSALPGKDTATADRLLIEELQKVGVDLLTSPVDTYDNARKLTDKILSLDTYDVKIAVPLNRWAEDKYHGAANASTAEWLPELPMEPRDAKEKDEWIQAQNQYLETHDDHDFWIMFDKAEHLGAQRFSDGGVGERLAREKFRSVLVFQHMMRKNTRSLPSLAKEKDFGRFAVWEAAQTVSVMMRGCADSGTPAEPFPCWDYPASFYEKMGRDRKVLISDLSRINLPWLIAGWLTEPNLQLTENGDAQIQHLHDAMARQYGSVVDQSTSADKAFVHTIYFSLIRIVKSIEALDEKLPVGSDHGRKAVNGCWLPVNQALQQWKDQTLLNLEEMGIFHSSPFLSPDDEKNVKRVISRVHSLILHNLAASRNKPTPGCEQDKTIQMSSLEFVSAIEDFERKMHGAVAEPIAGLVQQLKQ